MKNLLFLLLFLILSAQNAFAGGRIDIPDGPSGYFSMPDEKIETQGNYPFLLLLHDWWGVGDYMIEVTEKLKQEGFAVFALDFYGGRIPEDVTEAYQLSQGLSEEPALTNAKRALEYFILHPSINEKRIGVIGWSSGAETAMSLSLEEAKKIHAVGLYYAEPSENHKVDLLRSPLIAFYGESDRGIALDQIDHLKVKLDQYKKRYKIYTYPQVMHGFFHPASEGFDHAAKTDSWQKTLEFFKVNLA